MVCCTPPASRGGGGVSLGCQSPYTYSYVHTCVHTHVHTHRYTPGNMAQTCVYTPCYTPPCTHVHRDVHTWKGVHTCDTGQRGDRAGHLQGSRDTAAHRRPATTKGDGVPSRTCGEQGSETGENIRESHMGGSPYRKGVPDLTRPCRGANTAAAGLVLPLGGCARPPAPPPPRVGPGQNFVHLGVRSRATKRPPDESRVHESECVAPPAFYVCQILASEPAAWCLGHNRRLAGGRGRGAPVATGDV